MAQPNVSPDADAPQGIESREALSGDLPQPPLHRQDDSGMMDLPEWLRKLRAALEAEQSARTEEPEQEPIPSPSEGISPAPKMSTDEWLAELRENPPQFEDEPYTPPAQPVPDPNWMSKLNEPAAEEKESEPTEPIEPSWAREPGETVPPASPTFEQASDQDQEEIASGEPAVPWFEVPPAESTSAEPEDAQADRSPISDAYPPSFVEEAGPSPREEEEPYKTNAEQAELPDELNLTAESTPLEEEVPSETVEFEELAKNKEIPLPEAARDEEIPEWIRRLQPRPLEEQPEAKPGPEEELRTSSEAAIEAETSEAERERAEIDEWLRLATGSGEADTPEATPTGAPSIESAQPDEVPDWVASLQPPSLLTPFGSTSQGKRAEAAIEGLPGVVPLAHAIAEPHSTARASSGAEIQKGGHVFRSILDESPAVRESQVRVVPKRGLSARPVIYLLLMLSAVVPFLLPDEVAESNLAISNTPAAAFFDVLRSVPSTGTVLIAFDYEPSLAGEMDLQASSIVRDLSERNVKIIALSTLPTGPQLAQRVLDRAVTRSASYTYGTAYINLGYLPGQEAGLAQLATNGFVRGPRDYVRNQTLDKYPLTANLKDLNDVRLIIELAGSEEPLRMWMEQVQPHTSVQTIAGVSAAVEPRAQAYRDAKQLSAYLSGIIDAARLEILGNRSGLAVASVNALTWAQLVLILIIAAGNVIYWVSRMRGKSA